MVDTINVFGQRAEDLGESLLILLGSDADVLDGMYEAEKTVLFERIRRRANEQGIRGYRGRSGEGILERMRSWGQEMLAEKLPCRSTRSRSTPNVWRWIPCSSPGASATSGDALDMLTMGCYNTLWALRTYLEDQAKVVDEADRRSLALAKKWMGFEDWPENPAQVEKLRLAGAASAAPASSTPSTVPTGLCPARLAPYEGIPPTTADRWRKVDMKPAKALPTTSPAPTGRDINFHVNQR